MVFTPAWGGGIPLVKIGALKDWLKASRAYRRRNPIMEMNLVSVARPAVRVAIRAFVKTPQGKKAAADLLALTKGRIDIGRDRGTEQLMKDIQEFLRAQRAYQSAGRRGLPPKGLAEAIGRLGGQPPGAASSATPKAFAQTLVETLSQWEQKTDRKTDEDEEGLLGWMERRYRKKSALKFLRQRSGR